MTKISTSRVRALLLAAASTLVAVLAACGGGTDGTGGTPPPATGTAYSSGVMRVGSVIVNGVRYDDSTATVLVDDRTVARSELKDGMVIKLRGRINDDGVNGTAERVEIENELRGTVTAVGLTTPPTLTVSGVLVQTDESTVFANGLVITAGLVGQVVEVHGLRDASGVLRASRVEVQNGSGLVDEFKGAISAKAATTFTVGGVTVTPAATATYAPAGCSFSALAVGQIVEVHGGFTGTNAFSATRIECEDLEDGSNGVRPPAGARNEREGFVSGLVSTNGNQSGSFTLGDITVVFSATTQIRNGARADLANGVRVEVDGAINGTTLTAREISFKQDRVILQGTIAAPGTNQFSVLGRTVTYNSLTRIDGVTIAAGNRAEVRARLVNGTLIADEVRDAGGGGGGTREIVQARVTAKTADAITLLGQTYTLPAGAQYRNTADAAISRADFLAAITADPTSGTLVKVRGEPLSAGITEAELEN